MTTPKAGWTHTLDMVDWAEDVASFLAREKTNAQRCLHDCERLLSDPHVKSDSLKEGLRDLMSKTEDNFGTLLHLERVMSMKNLGDAHSFGEVSTSAMNIRRQTSMPATSMEIAASAPQFTQTGRFRQHRVTSFEFGEPKNNDNSMNEDASEDAFDPLKDELLFSSQEAASEDKNGEDVDEFDEDSGS